MRIARPLRAGIALTVAAASLVALAGCAPLDQKRILADVKHAVTAADPDLVGVDVEASKDGFANVLFVGVAVTDDTMDADRLRPLLTAAVDARGATAFDHLTFAVFTPDFHGDLIDLRDDAADLGVRAPDSSIRDDVDAIKKTLG